MKATRRALTVLGIISAGAFAITALSPDILAERKLSRQNLDASPLDRTDVIDIEARLRTPGVINLARATTHSALIKARHSSLAQSEEGAMARARELLVERRTGEAELLLRTLIERFEAGQQAAAPLSAEVAASSARARLLLARVLLASERPEGAISALDAIEQPTPIEDYRNWLRAMAYEQLHEPTLAHAAYDPVARDLDSPMAHRARVAQAHALFDAASWAQAAKALKLVNTTYPDYPRRHRSMHEYAIALDKLGRLDEAALAYQQIWFAYPYKERGKQARARMDELVALGHTVETYTFEERYKRWRRLRINKHWDTARTLFLQLAADIEKEEGPHAAMVHEIWLQLALNAYIPKRYEEALFYLTKLKQAWESGERAGVYQSTTYRYLATVLAKFGRLSEAVKELERGERTPRARQEAVAQFYKDHGRYEQAMKIYEELTPASSKKGWAYSWMLYKTHDFDTAHENFMALAERSSGRSRAQYTYWAARAKERAGETSAARALYETVWKEHSRTYYGLQAHSRLDDLTRRKELDSTMSVETDRITRSGDRTLMVFEDLESKSSAELAELSVRAALQEADSRAQPRATHLMGDALASITEPTLCNEDALATQSLMCDIAATQGAPTKLARPLQEQQAPTPSQPEQLARGEQRPAPAQREVMGPAQPRWLDPGPRVKLTSKDNNQERPTFATSARIFWEGRELSGAAFERYDDGEAIGPMPELPVAYAENSYIGGLDRAIAKAGDVFPQLVRAKWLMEIGMLKEARWAMRDVSMEFRELSRLSMPSTSPHQLKALRMTPLIDNRRVEKSTWGYVEEQYRWPVPSSQSAQQSLLKRQRSILANKSSLHPLLVDAMKEVGDYYMVRRYTLDKGGIRSLTTRMQAYPRAFPDLVIPEAKKWGVNPYLVWALMTVESSYNPDSVSTAEALGLLQVIPRTGLKTAQLLGEEDFGHYDLLDEDVAVRHGVFYFSRLVRKFRGQELFAIAGYNGGPHRVAEWVDMRGDMPMDEFVEEIPYDQARNYTKKVLRFLSLYLRTYEGIDTLYVGQKVNREWRPMPNF